MNTCMHMFRQLERPSRSPATPGSQGGGLGVAPLSEGWRIFKMGVLLKTFLKNRAPGGA